MCLVHKHRQGARIAVIHRELALVRPVDHLGVGHHDPEELLGKLRRQFALGQRIGDEIVGGPRPGRPDGFGCGTPAL